MTGERKGQMKGLMIYGFHPVLEALRTGNALRLFIPSGGAKERLGLLLGEAQGRGVGVERVEAAFFAHMPKGHQSVAALAREKQFAELDELLGAARMKGEPALLVAADGIEDPRNLGAIMRSALAAGAHGMILQKHRCPPIGPELFKASAGAAWHLPVSMHSNIKYALDRLADEGLLILGAESGVGIPPWQAELARPLVLVLGGEDTGMRKVVRQRCDLMLSLPMAPGISSLNVSVAAGVFLFEILRQRGRNSVK